MAEGEMQRVVAAHGDTGDGAVGSAGRGAVAFFDEREKFLQKKILVAVPAVLCIDVETRTAVRRGDQKIVQLAFFALVFDKIPEAGMDEVLFVVAEAVQRVEDGEVSGFVGVERRRENDAVRHAAGEDFAWESIAFDAAIRGKEREGEEEKEKEREERAEVRGFRS